MKDISPSGHAVFKVSDRANKSLDNPFFAAFENPISDALIGTGAAGLDNNSENYVCNRKTSVSPSVIDALRTTLPQDVIKALETYVDDSDISNCYFEIDLINFLLHSTSNKVLSIVGSIGIGKSTFIDFIFNHLRNQCESLKAFLPIRFNGLYIGDFLPKFDELFHRLHLDTIHILEKELDESDFVKVSNALTAYFQSFTNQENTIAVSSTAIIEYFNVLKNTLNPRFKPVLIFDNLDHMVPLAVEKFSHLARGVYLNTDFTVILCMRPPTFATHVEVDANKGAFYTFRINLPPPDISSILTKRLKNVFKSNESVEVDDPKTGFRLTIKEPFEAINNLSRNILHGENKNLLVKGIACNSVRKSLKAFYHYLRYSDLDFRNLFNVKIEGSYESESHVRKHDWTEHFFTGLMLGGNKYYKHRLGSPVYNLLYANEAGFDLDYCVKYRVITVFYFFKEAVSVSKVCQLLKRMGYERAFVVRVIEDLLKSYLLVSPEHEFNVNQIEYAAISDSGIYYFESIITNQKYLYEAVLDTPLNHTSWEKGSIQEFENRAVSIMEYLGRVISCEREHLHRISFSTDTAQMCAVLKSTGLLSKKIVKSAYEIASIGARSASTHVLNVAESMSVLVDEAIDDVNGMERELDELLKSRSYIVDGDINEQEVSWNLKKFGKSCGQLTVKFPDKLEPSGDNIFKTELSLKVQDNPETLIAWLESTVPSNMKPSLMCSLEKKDNGHYYGEIKINEVSSVINFPKSSLTILSDCRPLITREVSL